MRELTAIGRHMASGRRETFYGKTSMGFAQEIIHPIELSIGTLAWTTMAAAASFPNADATKMWPVDLSCFTHCRIIAEVSTEGAATAVVDAAFHPTGSATPGNWLSLCSPTARVSLAATGRVISSWQPIIDNARGDVYIGAIGSGGDGVASPALSRLYVQFRAQ